MFLIKFSPVSDLAIVVITVTTNDITVYVPPFHNFKAAYYFALTKFTMNLRKLIKKKEPAAASITTDIKLQTSNVNIDSTGLFTPLTNTESTKNKDSLSLSSVPEVNGKNSLFQS